jgi:hypothetical protein
LESKYDKIFPAEADIVWNETKDLPSTPAEVTQRSFPMPAAAPAATIPAIQNVFTILGDNVANSGVPCFECVTNGMGNTVGIVTPDTDIHADGATSYAFDNYTFDNSDTESCNYTFLVKDAAKKYILKVDPFSFALESGSAYLTSTAASLPKDPAAVGVGSVITLVQCGTTNYTSAMQTFISYP